MCKLVYLTNSMNLGMLGISLVIWLILLTCGYGITSRNLSTKIFCGFILLFYAALSTTGFPLLLLGYPFIYVGCGLIIDVDYMQLL
jgi:hypothetical protein